MWRATVLIESDTGHGAGVIIGAGSVLTAFHVVNGRAPKIEFFGGERENGAVSWSNEALDLAIVHVGVPNQYAVPALFCGELGSDQRLVAIGHPLTTRWVSVEGHLDTTDISGRTHLLPLSFDLSLGNSGGPVFDEAGRIVGIASAILVTQTVREIAMGARSGDRNYETGIGLMLPASEFCEEVGAV
jgi:putative serine protease PepD